MSALVNKHGDAAQMAAAVRQGEISARELLTATLARVEATDAHVNAFTCQTQDRAFAEADAVDARRSALLKQGESLDALGPLAGVPYAVKNLYDIVGEVTLAGSVINRSLPPAEADAFLVKQMKAAGAVLVGALNMDEYAYGFTTENTHYGPCQNPHDLARISGGSSGGSGAAVAAGQVPLSLGSDTNGSIRVPASLCGVWGLKPTFGRLSRRGTYPFVHSIDHLGPMANSVAGLALAYDALQGPDAHDPGCYAQRMQPVAGSMQHSSTGVRVGALNGYFDDHASAAAREVVALAARTLGTTASVHWPDAGLARAAAFIITASEGGSLHLDDLRTQLAAFEPLSVDRFIAGALQPADWYLRAQRFRRIYRDRINALFADWDVLITAATPVSAPLIGTEWLDINGTQQPCRAAMGLLTQPISFAGCPVVTAPMWPTGTHGMPLGLQIIAAPWREDLAFWVAQQLSKSGVAHVKIAACSSTTASL
jgi:amidase/aspartyl-tRNA(Asn)/glutamyl-tRNA(Gln) amidotransferase subunit A